MDQPSSTAIEGATVPPAPVARPPRIALRATLLSLLFMNALGGVLRILPGLDRFDDLAGFVALAVGCAGAGALAIHSVGERYTNYVWLAAPRGGQWITAVLLGAGVLGLNLAWIPWLPDVFPGWWEMRASSLAGVDALITPIGTLIMVGLVTPTCEELLFRGVILRSLLKRWGTWPAILVSSLVFGLFHLHPTAVLDSFVFGVVAGFAAVAARSVWVAVGMHVVNNSTAVIGGWISPDAELPMWTLAPSIACLGIGAWLLLRRPRVMRGAASRPEADLLS